MTTQVSSSKRMTLIIHGATSEVIASFMSTLDECIEQVHDAHPEIALVETVTGNGASEPREFICADCHLRRSPGGKPSVDF